MFKIKQTPEDFIVKEHAKLHLKKKGTHSIFRLKKKDFDTISACLVIAKRFHMPMKNVGFAGIKDKKAVTEQFISIKGAVKSAEKIRHETEP